MSKHPLGLSWRGEYFITTGGGSWAGSKYFRNRDRSKPGQTGWSRVEPGETRSNRVGFCYFINIDLSLSLLFFSPSPPLYGKRRRREKEDETWLGPVRAGGKFETRSSQVNRVGTWSRPDSDFEQTPLGLSWRGEYFITTGGGSWAGSKYFRNRDRSKPGQTGWSRVEPGGAG